MVTLAQRIEELRTERGVSRPALAEALGLPKNAFEKYETGRQTPSLELQEKIAAYFGVSALYLRGENSDRTRMDGWIDGAPSPADAEEEPSAVKGAARSARPAIRRPEPVKPAAVSAGGEPGSMFDGFLGSPRFRETLRAMVLEVLRSPEGQELLAKAVRRELVGRKQP